MIVLKFKTL